MQDKQKTLFVIASLAAVTLIVFWQVCGYDFVNYDDNRYVTENQHVITGVNIGNIIWAFSSQHFFMWHPLTSLSHMLDCELFGLNPGRHHLVNLLLHIANILLLFAVLKAMTGRLWSSAFVAALFALHPLNVESVAWVAERKNVLSGFFWMLTLAAYIRYTKLPGISNYVLLIFVFCLALMAKPTTVTLPFVLLLLDYWPLNRFKKLSLRKLIKEKIPLFVLSAIVCLITVVTQQSGEVLILNRQLPFGVRLSNVLISYVTYICKLIYPAKLAVFYPHPAFGVSFSKAAASFILLVFLSAVIFSFRRNKPYLVTGWLWFLGTLMPVIGLVQAGGQSMADRYAYIPFIGLFIIIAWAASGLLINWKYRRIALSALSVAVLSILAICTAIQLSYWQNSITLFEHTLEVTSGNYVACNNLGFALLEQNKFDEAINLFQNALKIKPDHVEALNNLGMAYGKLGRYQNVIKVCEEAIKIKPDYSKAYNNLAIAYDQLGRYQDAIETYKKAIAIEPDDARMYFNLGATYGELGRTQKEIDVYKKAISIEPNLAEAYYTLGLAYGKLGRYQEAIEAYSQAIKIKPAWADPYYNLGVAYLSAGNKDAAVKQYEILKTLNTDLAKKFSELIK